jgi:hypothetical protein
MPHSRPWVRVFSASAGLALLGACVAPVPPAPQPYMLYNISPAPRPIDGAWNYPQPALPRIETAPPAPAAPIVEAPLPPPKALAPSSELPPPVANQFPFEQSPKTAPMPASPPRVDAHEDDCVGYWWRICPFL